MDNIFSDKKEGVFLSVRVSPGAKRNGVEGIWNGTHLRVALQAPAVDGKANEALVQYLAKELKVKKKNIFIVTGETSRCKVLLIKDVSTEERVRIEVWLKQKLSMESK